MNQMLAASKECMGSRKQGYPEEFPSLFKYITSKEVAGFDTTHSPQVDPTFGEGAEATDVIPHSVINMPPQLNEPHRSHSILINDQQSDEPVDSNAVNLQQPKQSMFDCQLIRISETTEGSTTDSFQRRPSKNDRVKDEGFNSFKTWSGRFGLLSNLAGKPQEPEELSGPQFAEPEAVPTVDRYFESLEGPELDTLKASEKLILPEDRRWPFLLRFPISSFGMCLGMSSQAVLWKKLATSPSMSFLHVGPTTNLVLWCTSLALISVVSFIYTLKIIFYFEAVRREYFHPIRVNFFFAPWISCLFLCIGVPPSVPASLHHAGWYALMAPILCLELKIYGQWMSGGDRRLSKVANPSSHIAIVGNFVGALLGASMGLREGPLFFFAVGLAHYSVLFVTLCQRLPTNETLPKDLHPVFFLFVAAPSVSSLAWEGITGDFGYGSRIAYSIAFFLYIALAVRMNFFRGFRFSLAWWAYTIPMSSVSTATIGYANEAKHVSSQVLAVALSVISTLTLLALLVSTILHAFVLRDLFPNDSAIAIAHTKAKPNRKRTYLRTESSDSTGTCASVGTGTALQL